MRRLVAGLLIVISAVTLVLASTSLWLRRNVINTEVFVGNVETMIDLPEVEARITEQVTTTVMANPTVQDAIDEAVTLLPDRLQTFRPSVESGVRSVISAGVTRLLTNDPFRPLTTAALTSAHDQLVNGQPVEFTLGQAKDRVPASLRDGIAGQVLDLIPDDVGVTILTPADSPQVYSAVDLLKSAWWWLGLVALGTFAGALGVSRRRRGTLRAWAVTTTVLALLVLATLAGCRSSWPGGRAGDFGDVPVLGAVPCPASSSRQRAPASVGTVLAQEGSRTLSDGVLIEAASTPVFVQPMVQAACRRVSPDLWSGSYQVGHSVVR